MISPINILLLFFLNFHSVNCFNGKKSYGEYKTIKKIVNLKFFIRLLLTRLKPNKN